MTGLPPRTAAVVLNWRRPDDTLACVASLAKLDRPLDIVVVDNDSRDGSIERLRAELGTVLPANIAMKDVAPDEADPWRDAGDRGLLLTDSGRNGGYAFGNNVGARLALRRPDTAFIWILNNDTLVPGSESLDALIARMYADETIGICGSTVAYMNADRIQARGGALFQPLRGRFMPIGQGEVLADATDAARVERDLAYVNGAAAFVRRAVYETVGPMREDFFLYYEEFDWARRLRPRFKLGYAEKSVVYHAVGSTIGTDDSGAGSALSAYYLARNRMRSLARLAPASFLPALADEVRHALREWRRGRRSQASAIARALTGREYRP